MTQKFSLICYYLWTKHNLRWITLLSFDFKNPLYLQNIHYTIFIKLLFCTPMCTIALSTTAAWKIINHQGFHKLSYLKPPIPQHTTVCWIPVALMHAPSHKSVFPISFFVLVIKNGNSILMLTHYVPVTRDSSVGPQSFILNHFLGTPSNNGRQEVSEV